MRDVETRWRSLVDAGIAVTSELSLDAVLQRIVEAAAELTGAKYAALGVIDRSGRALERFLTTGIDLETHERIGDLPHGRGILGVLIRDAQPLRLHDLTADPRAVGFPPHHPLMRSFLGRADRAPRRRLREPVPDREGQRRGLQPRGRGARHAARRAGRGRDRERAPVRVGDALAGPARVADRGRQRAGRRDASSARSSS